MGLVVLGEVVGSIVVLCFCLLCWGNGGIQCDVEFCVDCSDYVSVSYIGSVNSSQGWFCCMMLGSRCRVMVIRLVMSWVISRLFIQWVMGVLCRWCQMVGISVNVIGLNSSRLVLVYVEWCVVKSYRLSMSRLVVLVRISQVVVSVVCSVGRCCCVNISSIVSVVLVSVSGLCRFGVCVGGVCMWFGEILCFLFISGICLL